MRTSPPRWEFHNPYPWMSAPEALVHLELESREIPFSWRFFDAEDAPTIRTLMPEYAPEFTLREYKMVIVVLGRFTGNVPAILDRNAIAEALLQVDGYKVVYLWEDDVRADVSFALNREAPILVRPPIKGVTRPNPWGNVDIVGKLRRMSAGRSYARTRPKLEVIERNRLDSGSRNDDSRGRRRPRSRRPDRRKRSGEGA